MRMKNRYIMTAVMAFGAVTASYSEVPAGFNEFRQGLMDDFNSFKSRVLEHYADFLRGEWHEYESLEAMQKFTEPKPSEMPVMELEAGEAEDQNKEMLSTVGFTLGQRKASEAIEVPDLLRWMRESKNLYNARPEADTTAAAAKPSGMILTAEGLADTTDGEVFDFYGMKFALPKVDFTIMPVISATRDYALQWENLVKQEVAAKLNPGIEAVQKASGISDYLMFEMMVAYLDHKFPEANDASKLSAAHFLLSNMGFGVRLAMDVNKNPFILIPFTEKIYGRSGLQLSRMYYVYSMPGKPMVERMGISSPYLPDNAENGKAMNLRMNGLTLPYKPHEYAFEYNGLKIKGEMNENIIPMLYKYPQMDTGGFGASMILPEVRDSVVKQLKEQLGDTDPLIAADKVLAMIQSSFPYATDDEFHGFEKPYFFEEILYYPKSDCEDRSVFYSYLLWHALGLESQLIAYPGHEAASLKAEKVRGGTAGYYDRDKKYFISDPTYLGAPTGQCMRRYQNVTPTIDLSYPE